LSAVRLAQYAFYLLFLLFPVLLLLENNIMTLPFIALRALFCFGNAQEEERFAV